MVEHSSEREKLAILPRRAWVRYDCCPVSLLTGEAVRVTEALGMTTGR